MRYVLMYPTILESDAYSYNQEELPAVIRSYERRGYFEEILSLMEAGLSLERAHVCHSLSCPNIA